MSDMIQLLPDHVANQIAAGEVIQRPASVVKELLENSVDAGATKIQLIYKAGGKSLIQVIDNGCGMSETDARMCFERHATSKIQKAEDLFCIRTMGFRGEAMASIAAVAQVELKTRPHNEELGTEIIMEGSVLKKQEKTACAAGTSLTIKNLFFNIPARRNFLKSDPVESRHILEEFQRVALAHPQLQLTLINDQQTIYQLQPAVLKKRIMDVMGQNWNSQLAQVEENTTVVKIHGFIGKPEMARKTRGDQYFFINQRYIKNPYLHHAILSGFQDLIPQGFQPAYFIFFDIDPSKIDINVHPTKTEVKFEDEASVYAILKAAVRKSIGVFNLSPSIDFNVEQAFEYVPLRGTEVKPPGIKVNPMYNPFESGANTRPSDSRKQEQFAFLAQQRDAFADMNPDTTAAPEQMPLPGTAPENPLKQGAFLLHQRFILAQVRSGLLIVDRMGAWERVIFERLMQQSAPSVSSQTLLFEIAFDVSHAQRQAFDQLQAYFPEMGFILEPFGQNTLIIRGIPVMLQQADAQPAVLALLDEYLSSQQQPEQNSLEALRKTFARQQARRIPLETSSEMLDELLGELFRSSMPHFSPSGRTIAHIVPLDEIQSRFKR